MNGIDVWLSFARCSCESDQVRGAAAVSLLHASLGHEKRASSAAKRSGVVSRAARASSRCTSQRSPSSIGVSSATTARKVGRVAAA